MHPSFNIRSGESSAAQRQLFLYAGWQGLAAVVLQGDNKVFTDIVCWHFTRSGNTEAFAAQMKDIFSEEPVFRDSYSKIDIIFQFPESILTPHEVYNSISNAEMLNLLYGDLDITTIKTDFMYRHNLHNIYRVPALLNDVIQQQFPIANYTHINSLLPDAFPGDGLFAFFSPGELIIMLRLNGKLQLVQTFTYSSTEDAAWHLLNVCRNFGADPALVLLYFFGTIEKDAALYKELYKYFLNMVPGEPAAGFSFPSSEYPGHYFSHLFAIAACV